MDFFFIDTSPFVQKYYSTPWANFTGAHRTGSSKKHFLGASRSYENKAKSALANCPLAVLPREAALPCSPEDYLLKLVMWQPGGLTEQSWQRQLAQLKVNLMTSRAKWKVVFGHHPPRSNGHHNNTVELIQHVEPLLQVSCSCMT